MIRNLFSTLILAILCTMLLLFCFVIVSSAQEIKPRPFHIGLVYPLSTNGKEAPLYANQISFHLLTGVSRQEEAFCLSGITNVIKENASGTVISGISNHVGGHANGLLLAGAVNQVKENMDGVMLTGVLNICGDARGIQVAGFSNIARNTKGLQLAGFMNTAKEATIQIAGFANITKDSNKMQLSGFINETKNTGNQVSGFINIAQKVKGVQIAGFLNIAEDSPYPIGLINIIKNGEKQIGFTIDESANIMLAFRSGGKVLYGIMAAGYNPTEQNAAYIIEGGLGAHFPIASYFRINLELTSAALTDLQHDVYFKTTTRLMPALKIANRLELFAGPTFNHLNFDRFQTDIRSDSYLWRKKSYHSFNGIYVGALAGVQINL